jgi:uncharacterized membrane protein YhaH (DUF805 family)
MTVGYWLLRPWRHAVDFSGRSPRREYWLFVLQTYALVLLAVLAAGLTSVPGAPASAASGTFMIVAGLILLASIVPQLAVGVRRLHDHGKSGLMLLLGLVPVIGGFIVLFFMLTEGDEQENDYGPNPLDPHGMATVSEVFD